MKILETKIMRGPNFWSNYRKHVIVLKLDLEELEYKPTNKIEGFAERLEKLIPSLFTHQCSEGHDGGFFMRLKEGTWMGHVIEHIALELQTLAGMDCGYGRTRSTGTKGVYHVVIAYRIEKAGLYALEAAMNIVEAFIKGEDYDLTEDLRILKRMNARLGLGPSTRSITEEAYKRNIPYKRMDTGSMIALGYGCKQRRIRATMSDSTSGLGIELAGNKEETKNLLAKAFIPVPKGVLVYDEEELLEAIDDVQFPLVIKPVDGNHGRGITTNINTKEEALAAFHLAKEISEDVIMEEFIQGFDYRFLVINFKLVAVAKRTPAMIMGDGKLNVEQLIEQTNQDPLRGTGHEKVMTTIKVDEITNAILQKKGLTLESVLPLGEILFLKDTANISTGGTSRDVTDLVHPFNVFMAERVARMLNLDICGIDVVASDINIPLTRKVGGVVEVNACPGLRMHLSPAKGFARNVAEPIIEMLFPEPDSSRIPIIAVTGTNGKTTTTRLIAHLATHTGLKVGYTTTDGIYIQGHEIHHGDCTGPVSAEAVLYDATVNFAVLECARGGILRSGLGFDQSDVSIVTNLTEDHLGLKDINTMEDMAKVKAVVARSTKRDGYSILNADDDLVFEMRNEVDCNIALFSLQEDNPRVAEHCEEGGLAAIIEKGYVVICKGKWKTRVEKVINIPLTLDGRSECMIKNVLPAVLTAFIQNFKIEQIKAGLHSFNASPEQTPGRMNIFRFQNFELMVDYAHNADGFTELKKFLDKTKASVKVGIISAAGDRRDEDIRTVARIAGQMFDEIIIRHDRDLRGRSKESMTELLMEGIRESKPQMKVEIISGEEEAIQHAIDHAEKNSFIVLTTDSVNGSLKYLAEAIIKEKSAPSEKREDGEPTSDLHSVSINNAGYGNYSTQ
ncbi:MAG: cyanophycin synthetase [Bacteroidota bacterium]|nr:cyanophycin synthetase [Bacteroidota bacterium]